MKKTSDMTIPEWTNVVASRVEALVAEKRPEWLKTRDGEQVINQSAMAAGVGIEQTTIGRLINRRHAPSLETLVAIATALDVELPDLFTDFRVKGDEVYKVDNPTHELFLMALDRLSEGELEWLSEKMRKMLAAHKLMMEEPEIYDLIYSDKDRQRRRDAGRNLGKKRATRHNPRKSA